MATENIPQATKKVKQDFSPAFKSPLTILPWFANNGWFKSLTSTECKVYFAIAHFKNWKTNLAHPGVKTLSNFTGLGASTIKRTIKKLELFGLIEIQKVREGKNRRYNHYLLHPDLHLITQEALEQIRQAHAEAEKGRVERHKARKKSPLKKQYQRLAPSTHPIKDILPPVLARKRKKSRSP